MSEIKANKAGLLINIFNEKCPNCGQTHVFKKDEKIFQMPVMYDKCEVCNYRFDREPGYFLGAMYISYGISIFFCLATFLLFYFIFPSVPTIWIPTSMIAVVLLIAKKNYKISRVIYIHIFPW